MNPRRSKVTKKFLILTAWIVLFPNFAFAGPIVDQYPDEQTEAYDNCPKADGRCHPNAWKPTIPPVTNHRDKNIQVVEYLSNGDAKPPVDEGSEKAK